MVRVNNIISLFRTFDNIITWSFYRTSLVLIVRLSFTCRERERKGKRSFLAVDYLACRKPFVRIWIAVGQPHRDSICVTATRSGLSTPRDASPIHSITLIGRSRAYPRIGWQRLRAEYSRIIDHVPRCSRATSAVIVILDDPTVDLRSDRESTAPPLLQVSRNFGRRRVSGGHGGPRDPLPIFLSLSSPTTPPLCQQLCAPQVLDFSSLRTPYTPIHEDKTSSSVGRGSERSRSRGWNAPSDCAIALFSFLFTFSLSSPEMPSQSLATILVIRFLRYPLASRDGVSSFRNASRTRHLAICPFRILQAAAF